MIGMLNTTGQTRCIAPILALIFILTIVVDGFCGIPVNATEDGRRLIRQGKQLLAAGEYADAAEVFQRALPLVQDKAARADLFIDLARTAHLMNDAVKTEEYLRAMFELNHKYRIDAGEHPDGFIDAFEKVKAEYWFSMRPDEEYREEAEKQVIANLSRKPKKKKIPTVLIIAAAAVVVGAIVALLILPSDATDPNETGTLVVQNRTEGTIWVGIGGTIGGQLESFTDGTYSLRAGSHDVIISNNEDTRTVRMTIIAGHQTPLLVNSQFWDVD